MKQKRIERHSIAAAAQTAFLFLLEEPLAVPICVCMVMAPLCLKDFDLNIRQRVAAAAGRDRKILSVKRHTLFGCCWIHCPSLPVSSLREKTKLRSAGGEIYAPKKNDWKLLILPI